MQFEGWVTAVGNYGTSPGREGGEIALVPQRAQGAGDLSATGE
jgi:hypothetical protein